MPNPFLNASELATSGPSASTLGAVLDQCVAVLYTSGMEYGEAVHALKKRWLFQVLCDAHGNQCLAAQRLHMPRNTFIRALKAEGIVWHGRVQQQRTQARAVNRSAETATAVNSVKGDRGESEPLREGAATQLRKPSRNNQDNSCGRLTEAS